MAGEGWHEGVKGIVASRLVNTYGVPALLFTIDGDEARGSGRSVGNVNLFEAVESISYLTKRFGGHGAAVGVTIPTDNLKAFAQRLDAYMQKLPEAAFHPLTEVDALREPGRADARIRGARGAARPLRPGEPRSPPSSRGT